jgi:hypothetical protein
MNEDQNLNGEITETPTGSQPETTTTGESNTVNPTGAENATPEEVSWNTLNGSSQDRFRQVTRDLNEFRRKEQEWQAEKERLYQLAQNPAYRPQTQEVPQGAADAVKKLSELGLSTKDEVLQLINQKLGGLVYQTELEKLEDRFDGANGMPKFDKDEYEDYVARNPKYRNYDPQDVYKIMYEPEIVDWKIRNQGQPQQQAQQTPSLRPVRAPVGEEPLTPELIEQRLNEPGGMEWYERNVSKINAVLGRDRDRASVE